MRPFVRVVGHAAVLDRPNLDTDVIIRIERLADARLDPSARQALARWAFETLRYLPDGSPDPAFFLNNGGQQFPILIAGPNFGCGSSREGAVWAIIAAGIKVIISESFGPIFHSNSYTNGLLTIQLPAEDVRRLESFALNEAEISVDLETSSISAGGRHRISFQIDSFYRDLLLRGSDQIDYTCEMLGTIEDWERGYFDRDPWLWPAVTSVTRAGLGGNPV